MATKTDKTKKTSEAEKSDDEVVREALVFNTKTNEYVPRYKTREYKDPRLHQAERAAQTRQAATAGALSVGGSLAQYAIGKSAAYDPAMKAMGQEAARVEAELAKGPDLLTEDEKRERRDAATAAALRDAEARQRRNEQILASTGRTGDVRSLIAAGDVGVAQVAQAALRAEAALAAEDVLADQRKKKADEALRNRLAGIRKTQFDLRQQQREALSGLVGDVVETATTVMAHAPAPSIDAEIAELRRREVPEEEIVEIIDMFGKRPKKARKLIAAKMKKSKPTSEKVEEEETAAAEEKAKVAEKAKEAVQDASDYTWTEGWAKYRLKEDGDIEYKDPDTNELKTVRKGTGAYNAIMALPTSPKNTDVPKSPAATEASDEETEDAGEPEATAPKSPESILTKYKKSTHEGSNVYSPLDDRELVVIWNEEDQSFQMLDRKTYEPLEDVPPFTIDDLSTAKSGTVQSELYQIAIEDGLIKSEGK